VRVSNNYEEDERKAKQKGKMKCKYVYGCFNQGQKKRSRPLRDVESSSRAVTLEGEKKKKKPITRVVRKEQENHGDFLSFRFTELGRREKTNQLTNQPNKQKQNTSDPQKPTPTVTE
jgi:hypothetical protein